MKAIILSAGTGTRLRPLTENIPKTLLKIDNITIIERLVKNFNDNGIESFIFVVGHFKDKVIEHSKILEDKYNISIEIVENKEYDTTNTSCSTYLASKDLNEDFILVNGDNVVDPKIIRDIVESKNSTMVIDNYKKLNEESFKIIIENNIIKAIGKNLNIEESFGEFIGLSKVVKNDLNSFNGILLKLIEEDPQNYYDFAYKELSENSKIDFVLTDGRQWTEIDDHDDWEQAQQLVKEFDLKTF
ncbi:phosphocholine cytidylyltransferase family protein [Methanobrevibacter filiformis]|uniref:Bifunctional IPC transferase and DIPP synthase n=1 Tax=Methanobrevibacter filiformis TaxID=55758 RepID=A0A166C2Q5_9EURY|nr:phosphocholine cytidylyltransferase family protein [Methanobrevibacter filiformis]KZX10827.1 bifunctional IPC transferase and DIPP synthase [Methanobrevibacter filiformis]